MARDRLEGEQTNEQTCKDRRRYSRERARVPTILVLLMFSPDLADELQEGALAMPLGPANADQRPLGDVDTHVFQYRLIVIRAFAVEGDLCFFLTFF